MRYKQFENLSLKSLKFFHSTVLKQGFQQVISEVFFNKKTLGIFQKKEIKKADFRKNEFKTQKNRLPKKENGFLYYTIYF